MDKKTEIETRSENDIMGIFLRLLDLTLSPSRCMCASLDITEIQLTFRWRKKCEKNFHLPCCISLIHIQMTLVKVFWAGRGVEEGRQADTFNWIMHSTLEFPTHSFYVIQHTHIYNWQSWRWYWFWDFLCVLEHWTRTLPLLSGWYNFWDGFFIAKLWKLLHTDTSFNETLLLLISNNNNRIRVPWAQHMHMCVSAEISRWNWWASCWRLHWLNGLTVSSISL